MRVFFPMTWIVQDEAAGARPLELPFPRINLG